MRKLVVAGILAVTSIAASAQHFQHDGRGDSDRWVAPLILGTIIGGVIASRPSEPVQPVYVQPPVYVPPPVYYEARPMYKLVDLYIPECNCYRTFRIQVQ